MANKELNALVHPYLFILQEGGHVQEDMLDFRLRMLHIRCFEVIKAPEKNSLAETKNDLPAQPEAKALHQLQTSE